MWRAQRTKRWTGHRGKRRAEHAKEESSPCLRLQRSRRQSPCSALAFPQRMSVRPERHRKGGELFKKSAAKISFLEGAPGRQRSQGLNTTPASNGRPGLSQGSAVLFSPAGPAHEDLGDADACPQAIKEILYWARRARAGPLHAGRQYLASYPAVRLHLDRRRLAELDEKADDGLCRLTLAIWSPCRDSRVACGLRRAGPAFARPNLKWPKRLPGSNLVGSKFSLTSSAPRAPSRRTQPCGADVRARSESSVMLVHPSPRGMARVIHQRFARRECSALDEAAGQSLRSARRRYRSPSRGAIHADRRRPDSPLERGQPDDSLAPSDPRIHEGRRAQGDGRWRSRCRGAHAAHAVGSECKRAGHRGRAAASESLRDPRQLPGRQAREPRARGHMEAAPGDARSALHVSPASAECVAYRRYRRLAVASRGARRPAHRTDGRRVPSEGGGGRPAASELEADSRSHRSTIGPPREADCSTCVSHRHW